MHILLVSPFHGRSSHADWARGLLAHSRHRFSTASLPDKAWRWRLKGGAVPLAEQAQQVQEVDLILATSMTCLGTLFGLLRRSPMASVPTVYYMHENQLSYPIRPGGKLDDQMVFRQFHSQLMADQVWFNSQHNLKGWFRHLPKLLDRYPDFQGHHRLEELRAKSKVVPVGLHLPSAPATLAKPQRPLLLWNQRWEWEKGIDRFCGLVEKFGPEAPFDVVLLGGEPPIHEPYRHRLVNFLGSRLLHLGWADNESYQHWMTRADLTVSTARHEFFGISLLEAAAHGQMLVLPDRLSYPELLPESLHSSCLYRSGKSLYRLVKGFLQDRERYEGIRLDLQRTAYSFCWDQVAPMYDHGFEQLVKSKKSRTWSGSN